MKERNIVVFLRTQKDVEIVNETNVAYNYIYSETEVDMESKTVLYDITDLQKMDGCIVLIATPDVNEIEEIAAFLSTYDIEFSHLSFLSGTIVADYLLAMGKLYYQDEDANQIILQDDYEYTQNKVTVQFLYGGNNCSVTLGKLKVNNRLGLYTCGDGCFISIGSRTSIVEADISCGHGGKIIIGEDCMLSHSIMMISDDAHHIFDLYNGKRMNYTKDIVIGDHVWIGRKVMLLGGATIGKGCVMGSQCVTSSTFPENVIVAGNPGKVIRKNILWTRDTTRKNSCDSYQECICKVRDIMTPELGNGNIKVSIIIPVYNVELYIEQCLLSALHQTLTDIEIICVNDGTPDNSMEIIERYTDDERIKIVNKDNGGLSSARNAGLQVATGEYVYFLDSDDYIKENTLEVLYSYAKEHDLDNIFFSAESFFESEEVEQQHENYKTYYQRKGEYKDVVSGVQLMEAMTNHSDYRPSACLQMPKRSFLIENNIRFYEGILHEDNLFTFQNMLVAKRVRFVDTPFYCRRVRANSIITEKVTVRNVYGLYTCFRETMNYYVQMSENKVIPVGVINAIKEILSYFVRDYNKLTLEEREQFFGMLDIQEELRLRIELQREFDVAVMLDGIHTAQKEQEIADVKNSITFKVGKAIMFIPHAIKRILKGDQ